MCIRDRPAADTDERAARFRVIVFTGERRFGAFFPRNVIPVSYTHLDVYKRQHEDSFAAVFNIAGITLRVSIVADFTPHEHTILGFSVPDVPATVKALRDKGVTFNIYQGVSQDELGVWTAPGATVRVAWLKDPDGNVLSVTNA